MPPTIHRRLAYVPSEANLWPVAHRRGGAALPGRHPRLGRRRRTATSWCERFDLELDKKIRAYSHGNRQKVLLIAAFASRADLLLLDEPTTGLDPLMEQVFRECVREAHDRGQTVLLSSHILSEVEAVCDRVAMLRAGRIIETGRLEVLRGLAALRVHAELDGPPSRSLGRPGREQRRRRRQHASSATSTGSMEPLLQALAATGVRRLTTREPSLEELFISHYGDAATGAGTRAMTSGVLVEPRATPAARRASPTGRVDLAIARRAFKQVWISATVWALVFGGTIAASALSYVNSFPDEASRQQLAASTSGDAGISILLGPVTAIDTVGGYTVYKCFVFLTTIGALWGLLAATRLLRGEEDAGRWQLVLAGRDARRRVPRPRPWRRSAPRSACSSSGRR